MPNAPVVHIEIPVRSLEVAGPFYEAVLRWRIGKPQRDEMGRFAMFARGHEAGGLLRELPTAQFGDGVRLYCPVADVPAALAAAAEQGGALVRDETPFPGGTYGLLSDPDGTVLGVCTE